MKLLNKILSKKHLLIVYMPIIFWLALITVKVTMGDPNTDPPPVGPGG